MNGKEDILKKYICIQPFQHVEFFQEELTLCCPTWLDTKIRFDKKDGEYDYDVWNSELIQNIRKSILDGTYSYCDKSACPHLSTLINTQTPTGYFIEKDKLPYTDPRGYKIENKTYNDQTPASINFTYDRSCNLKCPTCRLDTIMAKPDEILQIDKITDFIKTKYSKDARKLDITGSGDPFASKSFRKFLIEFDPELWPNLDEIYITTNGNLFNKQNWNLIKKAQPYIKMVEISIDAATKDTYENIVRLNGKWDVLMENLVFISQIESIKILRCSFVVQKDNYKEMLPFAKLIYEQAIERIKNQQTSSSTWVYFGKIAQWGHITDAKFKDASVWDPEHENYNDFVNEVNKLYAYEKSFDNMGFGGINIMSNFTDLIRNDEKKIIKNNKLI